MQPTAFTCDRCHAPLPGGVTVCPNCGQTFMAPVPLSAGPGYGMAPPAVKKGLPTIAIVGIVGAVGCLPLIAIFAAILFPVFAMAREKARETSSMSNLKQIGLIVVQYEQDHGNKYPPMDSMDDFKQAVNQYTGAADPRLYLEPGDNVPYALNASLSNQSVGSGDQSQVKVAYETVPHQNRYIAVLYGDGHVELTDTTLGGSGTDSGAN